MKEETLKRISTLIYSTLMDNRDTIQYGQLSIDPDIGITVEFYYKDQSLDNQDNQ